MTHPTLLSDVSGDVHLFFAWTEKNTGGAGSPWALMYARYHQGRWSAPVDILVSPDGRLVSEPSAAIDRQGYLHLLWKGTAQSDLYYSRAHTSQADQPSGWARPVRLNMGALSGGTFGTAAAIAVTPNDELHVIYSGQVYFGDFGGVGYIRSVDGGQNWSAARLINYDGSTGVSSDHARIVADDRGNLHATWTEFKMPAGWPPIGSFYSRSTDGGETWSSQLRVAPEGYALVTILPAGSGVLHRAWNGISTVGERWHQRSEDRGETWSAPQRPITTLSGGLTGYPQMAVDSAGTLHVVTAVDATAGQPRGVYYVHPDGTGWSQPMMLSRPQGSQGSIEQPSMAVSSGNELHVVWENEFRRVEYAVGRVAAPRLSAAAIPPLPLPTPVATRVVATPTTIPTPRPTLNPAGVVVQQSSPDPFGPLLLGALPVVALLAGVGVLRLVNR